MLSGDVVRDLLDRCTAAVLTTYRRDGSAVATPVWFRAEQDTVEVVIAQTDVKLRRLQQGQRCSLTVFETTPPFRALRIDATPEFSRNGVDAARLVIASRYLGSEDGERFARLRGPATVVSWPVAGAHSWDLTAILP